MIKGEGVYIRIIRVEDAQLVLQWENDKENWRFSENDGEYILLDILHLIDTMSDIPKAGQVRYIICEKETDKQLGTVDLFAIDFENGTAEVGVLVADRDYRQRGIAKESVILVEDVAKGLGVNEIFAKVQNDNLPSVKLFEAVGYKFIEELNDKKSLYSKCLNG